MTLQEKRSCPICQSPLQPRVASWSYHCRNCGVWISDFVPEGSSGDDPILEDKRETGLKSLRQRNFQTILNTLSQYLPLRGKTICDVGCGYGWFLEIAKQRGMNAIGVEPDREVAVTGIERGLNVQIGYFPDCLDESQRFDAIAFNDSLEHLPDLDRVLTACDRLLVSQGKLIINIPNSRGFFFQFGRLFYRLGNRAMWERLWQKNYPFPHLIYVNESNLERYLSQYGFKRLHSQSLPTLDLQGLWQRLRMDRSSPWLSGAIAYVGIVLSYPLLQRLPSDILLQIYEKR